MVDFGLDWKFCKNINVVCVFWKQGFFFHISFVVTHLIKLNTGESAIIGHPLSQPKTHKIIEFQDGGITTFYVK